MPDDTTSNGSRGPTLGQRMKHGVESKILVPVAATIVSAAASYLVKKLPILLEEKILPKLQEKGAPEPVTKVLEQITPTDDATAAAGGGSNGDPAPDEKAGAYGTSSEDGFAAERPSKSNDEREEQRREREERRRERRRATQKAA